MEVNSLTTVSDNIDLDYKINQLRDQHYQSVTDAEKVIRNDTEGGNEDEEKNVDVLANEHDKQIAEAKNAVMKIGQMQEEYRKFQSKASTSIASHATQKEAALEHDDFSFAIDQETRTGNSVTMETVDNSTKPASGQIYTQSLEKYITPQRPAPTPPTMHQAPQLKYEHFNNSHRRLVENSYQPTPAVCNNDDDLRSVYAQMCFARPSTKMQIKVHFSDTVFFDDKVGYPSIWYATSRSGLYRVKNENVTVKGILQRLRYHAGEIYGTDDEEQLVNKPLCIARYRYRQNLLTYTETSALLETLATLDEWPNSLQFFVPPIDNSRYIVAYMRDKDNVKGFDCKISGKRDFYARYPRLHKEKVEEDEEEVKVIDRMIEQESIICAKQIAAAIDSRRQGFNSDLHGLVLELVCDVSGTLYLSTVLSMFWKAADTSKIQEKQNALSAELSAADIDAVASPNVGRFPTPAPAEQYDRSLYRGRPKNLPQPFATGEKIDKNDTGSLNSKRSKTKKISKGRSGITARVKNKKRGVKSAPRMSKSSRLEWKSDNKAKRPKSANARAEKYHRIADADKISKWKNRKIIHVHDAPRPKDSNMTPRLFKLPKPNTTSKKDNGEIVHIGGGFAYDYGAIFREKAKAAVTHVPPPTLVALSHQVDLLKGVLLEATNINEDLENALVARNKQITNLAEQISDLRSEKQSSENDAEIFLEQSNAREKALLAEIQQKNRIVNEAKFREQEMFKHLSESKQALEKLTAAFQKLREDNLSQIRSRDEQIRHLSDDIILLESDARRSEVQVTNLSEALMEENETNVALKSQLVQYKSSLEDLEIRKSNAIREKNSLTAERNALFRNQRRNKKIINGSGRPFQLYVWDILASQGNPKNEMEILYSVFSKFYAELRHIYVHYATHTEPVWGETLAKRRGQKSRSARLLLTMQNWRSFVKDLEVIDAKLFPVGEVEIIFRKATLGGTIRGGRRIDLDEEHKAGASKSGYRVLRGSLSDETSVASGATGREKVPYSCMIMREFLEAILRLAHQRFPNIPHLADRLTHLINNHVLMNCIDALSERYH